MNINYILTYKTFFLIFLLTIGCNKETKYTIIPPEQFADIYLELQINPGIEFADSKSLSKPMTDSTLYTILKKYNFTVSDLKYTTEAYNKDITKWQEFYENLRVKLEKLYSTLN